MKIIPWKYNRIWEWIEKSWVFRKHRRNKGDMDKGREDGRKH